MTLDQAKSATRNGAIAALISAALTLLFIAFAMISNTDADFVGLFNDPFVLLDVLIIVGCAYAVRRYSRGAAIFLIVYFVFNRIYFTLETGSFQGGLVSLVFLFFYVKAAQGTFVYHKLAPFEVGDYTPPRKRAFIGWALGIVVGTALLIYALMLSTGGVPPTRVVSGDKVLATHRDELVQMGVYTTTEKLVYMYSSGLSSLDEGGSLLTDVRVVVWLKGENGELETAQLLLGEVDRIELVQSGNTFNESFYKVYGRDGAPMEWIALYLSDERNGNEKFVEELRKRIPASQ